MEKRTDSHIIAMNKLILPFLILFSHLVVAKPEQTPFVPQYAPLPAQNTLVALNEHEENAGMIVLFHHIEMSAEIPFMRNNGTTQKKHRARYLILDSSGVKRLSQHTFFSDTAGEKIENINGRTITKNGEIHPIDPLKDVRDLDSKDSKGNSESTRKTINFPRVEPGAVLDLYWEVNASALPSLELVNLQNEFPVRELKVRSQGQLISAGKSFWKGTGEYYWVPFFLGLIPENVEARLSSQLDLELTARNLESFKSEALAPPATRTSFYLGIIPVNFSGRQWPQHVHLFGSNPEIPERKKGEIVYIEGPVEPGFALATMDELGLQEIPEWATNTAFLSFFQNSLKYLNGSYLRFIKKARVRNPRKSRKSKVEETKTRETKEDVLKIAPHDMPFRERVVSLFYYARDNINLDLDAEGSRSLDKMLKKGSASSSNMRNYVQYLLNLAEIESNIVLALSRHGPPFQPIIEAWQPFDRDTFLEVVGFGGERLYLDPGDPFADEHAFRDSYLGALVFRQPDDKKEPWVMTKIAHDANVVKQTKLKFFAKLPDSNGETSLNIDATLAGMPSRDMRLILGHPFKDMTAEKLEEYRQSYIKKWIKYWTAITIDADKKVDTPDPTADVRQPFQFSIDVPWSVDIQDLGEQWLVPMLPPAEFFQNVLLAEDRQNAIWLKGGSYQVSMSWQIPAGVSVDNASISETVQGPGNLSYKLERGWDESNRILQSSLSIEQPYMLSREEYTKTRQFFEQLQRDVQSPILMINKQP